MLARSSPSLVSLLLLALFVVTLIGFRGAGPLAAERAPAVATVPSPLAAYQQQLITQRAKARVDGLIRLAQKEKKSNGPKRSTTNTKPTTRKAAPKKSTKKKTTTTKKKGTTKKKSTNKKTTTTKKKTTTKKTTTTKKKPATEKKGTPKKKATTKKEERPAIGTEPVVERPAKREPVKKAAPQKKDPPPQTKPPDAQEAQKKALCAKYPRNPKCAATGDQKRPPPTGVAVCVRNPTHPSCGALSQPVVPAPPVDGQRPPSECEQNPNLQGCGGTPQPTPPMNELLCAFLPNSSACQGADGGRLPPAIQPPGTGETPPDPCAANPSLPECQTGTDPTSPPPSDPVDCPEGQYDAGGFCVLSECPAGTYRAPPDYACVAECPAGTTSTTGTSHGPYCSPQCPAGQVAQFIDCVDQCGEEYPITLFGVCRTRCPEPLFQSGDQCVLDCPEGQYQSSSRQCFATCPEGTVVQGNACVTVTPSGCLIGTFLLDGDCVSIEQCYQGGDAGNVAHDGYCLQECPGNLLELGSQCHATCPQGWHEEDGKCRIYCADEQVGSEYHFGTCVACPSGTTYQGSAGCVSDSPACPPSQYPIFGTCFSPDETTHQEVVNLCISKHNEEYPDAAASTAERDCIVWIDTLCTAAGEVAADVLFCTDRLCFGTTEEGYPPVNGICGDPPSE